MISFLITFTSSNKTNQVLLCQKYVHIKNRCLSNNRRFWYAKSHDNITTWKQSYADEVPDNKVSQHFCINLLNKTLFKELIVWRIYQNVRILYMWGMADDRFKDTVRKWRIPEKYQGKNDLQKSKQELYCRVRKPYIRKVNMQKNTFSMRWRGIVILQLWFGFLFWLRVSYRFMFYIGLWPPFS